MEHAKSVVVKMGCGCAAVEREGREREEACHKDVRAGLFQKCPSVDTHSGVTLQQTYYLLFCHFGFSTTNLGPDSISAPEMSAPLTITRALSLSSPLTHPPRLSLPLSPSLSGCVPLRKKMVLFTALHRTLKKHLAPDPEFMLSFFLFSADIKLFSTATVLITNRAAKQKYNVCRVCGDCQEEIAVHMET